MTYIAQLKAARLVMSTIIKTFLSIVIKFLKLFKS